MVDDADTAGWTPAGAFLRDAWEFHDLLFHARSRRGRCDAVRCHVPAGRPDGAAPGGQAYAGRRIYTSVPARSRKASAEDPPLSRVVEQRRSIREYGDRPLTSSSSASSCIGSPGSKMSRTSRSPTPHGPMPMAMASRPYPSGGALYELEFYAAIASCDGLDPGLYYYEPRDHGLIRSRADRANSRD